MTGQTFIFESQVLKCGFGKRLFLYLFCICVFKNSLPIFNEYYTQLVTSILLMRDINVSYYDIEDINVSNFHLVLIFTHF